MANINRTDSANVSRKKVQKPSQTPNYLDREEEYRRINAELEAKTAALVNEADQLLNAGGSNRKSSLLMDAFEADIEKDLEDFPDGYSLANKLNAKKKPQTSGLNRPLGIGGTAPGEAAYYVATIDDTAATTDFQQDLHKRLISVAARINDDEDLSQTQLDSVIPPAAEELSVEAQMRFLKAKLRVLQEENDKLCLDVKKKHEEVVQATNRMKQIEEERNHLNRTSASHKAQADKYKALADEMKDKNSALEVQTQTLKKELSTLKRSVDQQGVSQKSQTVRLHRALEDVEKLKAQLNDARKTHKEALDKEHARVEQLLTENKRLEKQKTELIAGYKRQMRLIDVLKRQRMHIEAAKLLQFTEEDFMRALDWAH